MIRRTLSLTTLLLLAGPAAQGALAQSIPTAIPYTGSVAVNGIPFSGEGHFKFAIVDQTGNTTYWSNSALEGSVPVNDVTVVVSNGLYALELGNPDLANMLALPPAVFANPMTFLRVWFSDGVNGFQLLSPDRQLVSVPYAFQAEKANEISGTGTVVKSLALAETPGVPLTDDILLEGAGNVDVQQIGSTIRIVGTDGTAAAVGLACATPCVSSDEISGTLTDAQIPAVIARDAEVTTAVSSAIAGLTDAQIPATIARDSEVATAVSGAIAGLTDAQIPATIARDSETAAAIAAHGAAPGAHTLSALAGSVTDAQIPAAITRDSEVPGLIGTAVSGAIATHSTTAGAHTLSVLAGSVTDAQIPDLGTLSGVLVDAQIPSAISRDSEVTTSVSSAIAAHGNAAGAHTLSVLAGSVTDAQIPTGIARDSEVPALIGTAVSDAITTHSTAPGAHTLSALAGSVTDTQVPATIARDSEVSTTVSNAITAHSSALGAHTLSVLAGSVTDAQIPTGIARDSEVPALIGTAVSDAITTHSAAPGAHTLSALAGSVTDAQVPDLGTLSGVLVDAQIPSAISRDSEVTASVSSAIAAHGNAAGAHTLSVLAGSVTDAQIPAGIARDSEVSALLGSVVRSLSPSGGTPLTNDIVLDGAGTVEIQQSGNTITIVGTTGAGAATDLACATPCVSSAEISGTLTDPQIPATISRDAEVSAAIAAHAALDDAHALSSFTTGTLTETRIDAAIARDSEVPGLIGTAVSDEIAAHSVAPGAHTLSALAGSVTDAQVPDLDTLSGVLTDAQIPDLNALSGVLTSAQIPATITHDLNVTGTVTVVALAAGYRRVVRNNLSAPTGATTTLDAQCASGSLLSGGYELDTFPAGVAILGSWPASGSTWSVKVENQSGTDVDVDLYAVCAAIQ